MYSGVYKERYIGFGSRAWFDSSPILPRWPWESCPRTDVFLLLFIRCLSVLWDSSCSGTWGWCPGSSACAQKCFDTYPSPLSPEKKQVHDKCHEKIPSWMMLIKMMMLAKINDNTWSWITLLLCMFALISSWTWGSGIIDHQGARSNSW